MPEVFCDTSPIQYFHQLGLLELLPKLYGRVNVPLAVARELEAGRQMGVNLPAESLIPGFQLVPDVPDVPFTRGDLGAGERQILTQISLASGRMGIIDDRLARLVARHCGLTITGTLGVLLRAKTRGFIGSIRPLLDQLAANGFRIDEALKGETLRLANE